MLRPMASSKRSKAGLTYAASGVDIQAGDAVVDRIASHLRRTRTPRVLGEHGAFAGMFRLDYNERLFKRNYREPVLVGCTDGVGTKVLLARQMGLHHTIGRDCVAMNINDLIVQGAEPLFFLDYVGVHAVDPSHMEQVVRGVADGCRDAGCALLGGETAEMPDVYGKGDYDLAGFAVGVSELRSVTSRERVQPGDVVLGLASSGVHSNGYSLVRAILKRARLKLDKVYATTLPAAAGFAGHVADADPSSGGTTLGQLLLEPTRIYAKSVVRVLRRYTVKRPITGMAHITGGGLEGNVNRALPDDCDAVIDRETFDVPALFRFLQDKGGVEEAEMWRVFNMGIGYVLIVRPHFAESIQRQLRRAGETVSTIGKITRGSGQVKLR
jgi:phosphoribosylformylglycinamidine cyclo-ligase